MNYYRRKLPHWQPASAEYFITIRLKGSLPQSVINKLKILRQQLNGKDFNEDEKLKIYIQRRIFRKFEDVLEDGETGSKWLSQKAVANLVEGSIHYRDSELYDLYAYCIMPNHVHLVFRHLIQNGEQENPITDIMRDFKRYTGRKCNKLLNRTGAFWQSESYDHVIRNPEELENTIRYTLYNPVKAGLVERWQDWPYSYCKPEFVETFA